jgi:hypothetical protein
MTTTTTIKEQMQLLNLKTAKLAEDMGLEYGLVSTAISMDAKGEVPKRQSVRDRIEAIKAHLAMELTIADRAGSEGDPGVKWRATVWDSPAEALRRFPTPPGCEVNHDLLGKRVRLDLDGQGADTYRVLRQLTNAKGSTWFDVLGGENGGMRSITPMELSTGKRVR